GQATRTLPGQPSTRVSVLAWSADDQELISSTESETRFWDVRGGRLKRTLKEGATAWNRDKTRFANSAGIVDAKTGKRIMPLQNLELYNSSNLMAWSGDGRWLAVSDAPYRKRAFILDATSG